MCLRRSRRLWFLLLVVGWVSGLVITHRPRVVWGCWVSILMRPRSRVGSSRGISVLHVGFWRGWIRRARFCGIRCQRGGGCRWISSWLGGRGLLGCLLRGRMCLVCVMMMVFGFMLMVSGLWIGGFRRRGRALRIGVCLNRYRFGPLRSGLSFTTARLLRVFSWCIALRRIPRFVMCPRRGLLGRRGFFRMGGGPRRCSRGWRVRIVALW